MLIRFVNCSNPASPILIMESSVFTRNTLSFIPAEGTDQVKTAFTCRGLKHTQVVPYGCNGLRNVLLVDATDLGGCFVQNETTDFGMSDEK